MIRSVEYQGVTLYPAVLYTMRQVLVWLAEKARPFHKTVVAAKIPEQLSDARMFHVHAEGVSCFFSNQRVRTQLDV